MINNGYPNDALKQFQLGGFWASKPTSGVGFFPIRAKRS